jgi:hypothetical protein
MVLRTKNLHPGDIVGVLVLKRFFGLIVFSIMSILPSIVIPSATILNCYVQSLLLKNWKFPDGYR